MSLTLDQHIIWLFPLNVGDDVVLSLRGMLDPTGMAATLGDHKQI